LNAKFKIVHYIALGHFFKKTFLFLCLIIQVTRMTIHRLLIEHILFLGSAHFTTTIHCNLRLELGLPNPLFRQFDISAGIGHNIVAFFIIVFDHRLQSIIIGSFNGCIESRIKLSLGIGAKTTACASTQVYR
jgi:hypothetical protein